MGNDIRRIAVIGAGLMGHGIALEFAAYGYDVALHDRDPVQLERANGAIAEGLARLVDVGRVSERAAAAAPARIAPGIDLRTAVAGADLIVEAVAEDLAIKQALVRDIDAWSPPHAIIASNTSTFMPSQLAGATRRPDRVLVAHYFNPPHLLPLVELVRGPATSDATIDTMRSFYRAIGKRPAVVQREALGFVGNRLQNALLREALAIVEAGVATPEDVDTIVKTGFGRRLAVAGPFEIADAGGVDVWLTVAGMLFPDLATAAAPPAFARDLLARGDLGLKTGRGFYDWTPEQAAALRERIGQGLAALARLADGDAEDGARKEQDRAG
ncbi:MAG TPA: 3-hydroxyacyl-CoA dehydrogenase family protein [Thermomicrobiales bacterium]|nr:3-hydroxyacyl-CoA dehydrogenase family protein [Thermomicrobiales bacterium]